MVQRLLVVAIAMLMVVVWSMTSVHGTSISNPYVVVEWLKFRVDPTQRDHYLTVDNEIWTSALKTYPGFLDKVIWLDPKHEDEVIFVITWETRQHWYSIPDTDLAQINQQFDAALGFGYDLIEAKEYTVPSL